MPTARNPRNLTNHPCVRRLAGLVARRHAGSPSPATAMPAYQIFLMNADGKQCPAARQHRGPRHRAALDSPDGRTICLHQLPQRRFRTRGCEIMLAAVRRTKPMMHPARPRAAAVAATALGDRGSRFLSRAVARRTRLLFHSNRSGRPAHLDRRRPTAANPRILFDGARCRRRPGDAGLVAGRAADRVRDAAGRRGRGRRIRNLRDAIRDGRGLRPADRGPGDNSHPHWSRRRQRIYFNSPRATPDLEAEWSGSGSTSTAWRPTAATCAATPIAAASAPIRCRRPTGASSPIGEEHRRAGRDWELEPDQRNSEVFVTPLDGSTQVNVSSEPGL